MNYTSLNLRCTLSDTKLGYSFHISYIPSSFSLCVVITRQFTRRHFQEMHQDLSKPWVNPYLKKQIMLKYRFKEESSNSKQLNDFEKFQEQRKNVDHLTKLARDAFFRQQPDQVLKSIHTLG